MSELIGVWDWLRSFFAGWDLSEGQYGLIGVMLGFLLSQGVEWIRRRKRHNAFWHAINAELIYSGELAEVFLTDPVQALATNPPETVGQRQDVDDAAPSLTAKRTPENDSPLGWTTDNHAQFLPAAFQGGTTAALAFACALQMEI
jgi:hypothetical protein